MKENLNEVDNTALRNIEEEVELVSHDLDNLLGYFKGDMDMNEIWSYQSDFETYMRNGRNAISNFENYVIEHPLTLFDKEVIKEFEYQKELYEFRKELLIDIFKEALKRGFHVIR